MDPPLPVVAVETFQLERGYDSNNNEIINQYRVEEMLGEGAFGKVYRGEWNEESFALKVCSVMGLRKNKFFAADGEYADSLEVL